MLKWLKRGATAPAADQQTETVEQTTNNALDAALQEPKRAIQDEETALIDMADAALATNSVPSVGANAIQDVLDAANASPAGAVASLSTGSTDVTTGGRHAVPLDDSAASQLQPLLSAEVMEANNLPANVQQALGVIVAIAQQMDARLARVERQLNELDPHAMGLASTDDIHALRLDNARLSAEIAKSAIALRDRIDEVEFNRPATPAHEERVNRLAQQIATLSDSYGAADK
jgi:hypothetical protein